MTSGALDRLGVRSMLSVMPWVWTSAVCSVCGVGAVTPSVPRTYTGDEIEIVVPQPGFDVRLRPRTLRMLDGNGLAL